MAGMLFRSQCDNIVDIGADNGFHGVHIDKPVSARVSKLWVTRVRYGRHIDNVN